VEKWVPPHFSCYKAAEPVQGVDVGFLSCFLVADEGARWLAMKSDFMLAINQLCSERKLSREVVLEAVEAALISAYKRNFGSATNIEVRIEPSTGETQVFAIKEVVETVQDRKTQVSLAEARQEGADVELGGVVKIESTPRDFGRIAAQTAKQVILQRIREAERDAQYSAFAESAGEIALGTVQSVDYPSGDVIVNLEGAEALLPAKEQVPGEHYRRGARLRAYVTEVRRGSRGAQITLSRRSPALLRRLLELEVPEIFSGTVEIKAIAREAGSRSKVAVHATQEGVDPVGSCVGVRGGRIQTIVSELGGEKIDVVQWSADVAAFIANALSPAKAMNVILSDDPEVGKTATVIVPDRQLSLAIGKEGQNARLAAKLTGWRIDIKSATETAEETLGRFEDIKMAPEDMDLLSLAESILRGRVSSELSSSERDLIETTAERRLAAGLPWPKPAEGEAVTAPAAQGQPASEIAAPVAVGPAVGAPVEEATLAEGTGPEEEAEPATGMALAGEITHEVETEPTFEGEPVEDSIGWVLTAPAPEYAYGQPEAAQWEEGWDPQLVPEDLEEEKEVPKAEKKKKKSRRVPKIEEELPTWGRRGQKPTRSR